MDWTGLDWVAIVIVLVFLSGVLEGASKGFIVAVVDLLGVLFVMYIAYVNYYQVADLIRFIFSLDRYRSGVFGFIITLILLSTVMGVAEAIISRLLAGVTVSSIDRLLGGIVGAAKSYIIVIMAIWVILSFPISALVGPVRQSRLSEYVVRSVPEMLDRIGFEVPPFLDPWFGPHEPEGDRVPSPPAGDGQLV